MASRTRSLQSSWGKTQPRSPPTPERRRGFSPKPRASPSPLRQTQRATSPPPAPAPQPNNDTPSDPGTELEGNIGEADAVCTIWVRGQMWVAEKEGDITIRDHSGQIVHIIERRKGAFVWSMISVEDRVWAGCSDGFIRILSIVNYRMEHQASIHQGGGPAVWSLAFHQPTNTILSGSQECDLAVWNESTFELVKILPTKSPVRVIITDNNNIYAGLQDGTIAIYDANNPQAERASLWSHHSQSVLSLCRSEKYLWSGSEDQTLRIWEPSSGECLGLAEVHSGPVNVLKSIGNKVWSSAGDTICVWDALRLKLLGTYIAHGGQVDTITPVEKTLITGVWTTGQDKQLKSWKSTSTDWDGEIVSQSGPSRLDPKSNNEQLSKALADVRSERELRVRAESEIEYLRRELLAKSDAGRKEELHIKEEHLEPLRLENQSLKLELESIQSKLSDLQKLSQRESENQSLIQTIRKIEEDLTAEIRKRESVERELKESIQTIDNLKTSLNEEQNRGKQLEADWVSLTTLLEQLRGDNTVLLTALDRSRAENAQLNKELNESKSHSTGYIRPQADLSNVSQVDNDKGLQDKLNKAYADLEIMSLKLKEMDNVFKSRLRMITEVYKVYRKLEQNRKSLPSNSEIKASLTSALAEFKSLIAVHYTDDELIHLGSSRHFFPNTISK